MSPINLNVDAAPFWKSQTSFYPGHTPVLTLVPNPYYYGLKPHVTIKLPDISSQFPGEYRRYLAGQLDEIGLPAEYVARWKGKSAQYHEYSTSEIAYLAPNVHLAPFSNVHCRLALAYAIDRNALANQVLGGTTRATYAFVARGMLGYYDGRANPHYSLTRARAELARCPGRAALIHLVYPKKYAPYAYRAVTIGGRSCRYGAALATFQSCITPPIGNHDADACDNNPAMSRPIRLQALSYHSDVTAFRSNVLAVQSVFAHAWNLRTPDGWVVTVTSGPYDGPLAIRVDAPSLDGLGAPTFPGCSPSSSMGEGVRGVRGSDDTCRTHALPTVRLGRKSPVEPGDKAFWIGTDLIIGAVRVVTAGASPWAGRLIPADFAGASRESGSMSHLHDLFPPSDTGYGPEAERLVEAFVSGDEQGLRIAAHHLLGRGTGFTPEGDDLLVGFLCGLAVWGNCRSGGNSRLEDHVAANRMFESLRDYCDEMAASRTTAVSRTILHYAGRGVAIQPLLDVVSLPPGAASAAAVGTLLGVGHNSGHAMLSGACLAVRALERREGCLRAGWFAPTFITTR